MRCFWTKITITSLESISRQWALTTIFLETSSDMGFMSRWIAATQVLLVAKYRKVRQCLRLLVYHFFSNFTEIPSLWNAQSVIDNGFRLLYSMGSTVAVSCVGLINWKLCSSDHTLRIRENYQTCWVGVSRWLQDKCRMLEANFSRVGNDKNNYNLILYLIYHWFRIYC